MPVQDDSLTRCHDESGGGVFGQYVHPPQLDVEELAPALGQVEGAPPAELWERASEQAPTGLGGGPRPPYLAVDAAPQAVGGGRMQQLPGPALVEGDDGAHVVLAERAVDKGGDEDASQPLHPVQVCKRLVGKVPEGGGVIISSSCFWRERGAKLTAANSPVLCLLSSCGG